jgi:hypothetical protein
MSASRRSKIVVPMVSLLTIVAFAAQAQTPPPQGQGQPAQNQPPAKPQVQAKPTPPRPPTGVAGPKGPGPDARYARGAITPRDYGGQAYRGRVGWEGGRWRHEVHNGRDGWWWDVGGVWYYYPTPVEGPPTYVSEDFADDVVYAQAPSPYYPPPPPGPYYAAPPPPPPPPDPGASAIGGAVVGGLLGGLLTGRAAGAAAGAVIGGATGAIAGATAASRPGYYLAQGACYYRYPNGQYVAVDPRWCY